MPRFGGGGGIVMYESLDYTACRNCRIHNGTDLIWGPGVHLDNNSFDCSIDCPVEAIFFWSDDGRVLVEPNICIACDICVGKCRYGVMYRYER